MFLAADFGAAGDGQTEDGAALQRALDAAIAAGPGTELALAPGRTYRLGPQPTAVAVLRIVKASGLTLSGNGATLLTHPTNRPVTIFDSRNIQLRDLALDFAPIPFTQARLTAFVPAHNTVRFRIEPGYAEPALGGPEVYRDFKSSDAVFLDGATRKFTHRWGRISRVNAVGPCEYEAGFHRGVFAGQFAALRLGDFIALKLPFPEPPATRDAGKRYLDNPAANIYVTHCRNVRLERIISYAAPGMTVVATGSEGLVLEGCKILRKPGTGRLIASNSDGAHFKSLTVMPQVRHCAFEALMDDSINIKISSEVIREVHGSQLRLAHGDIATDDIVIEPGQTLSFTAATGKRHLGHARVTGVERLGYRDMRVTLATPVPELAAGDLAFLRPETDAVVSQCEFRTQLKTALLTHPPTLVSSCAFEDVAYGVHAAFTGNIEGPPPCGLRVSDCTFDRPSVAAIALHLPSAHSAPPGCRAILAEDCRIAMGTAAGRAITASRQSGMVLRNLRIVAPDGRTREDLVALRECTAVSEENVTFRTGPSQE